MSDDDVRLHVEWYERTRAASAWRRDLKADQQRDLAHLTAWFDSESAKVASSRPGSQPMYPQLYAAGE